MKDHPVAFALMMLVAAVLFIAAVRRALRGRDRYAAVRYRDSRDTKGWWRREL